MKTRDLEMSIEPINKRFPDATNEILLEPLKSPSNDEDLLTWRPLMVEKTSSHR